MKVEHGPQDPQEAKNYSIYWFLLSAILLFSSIWYVVDEAWVRRPWKRYQNEFNWKELEALEGSLKQEVERLESEQGETIRTLRADAKKGEAMLESAEMLALVKEKEKKEKAFKELEQERAFTKADLDEAVYLVDHARLHGQSAAKLSVLEKRIQDLESHLKEVGNKTNAAEKEFRAAEEGVRVKETEILAAERDLERIFKTKTDLESKIKVVRGRMPEIKQVVAAGLGRFGRVDRCESCHAGINRSGFEDWPQPFTTHPRRAELFGPHPPETFGCTACHHGVGRYLTPFKAHAYEVEHDENGKEEIHYLHHWDEPMYQKPFMEAACNDCHGNQYMVPQAKTWQYATKLFVELGCHGCHLVNGYENLPKMGPSLRRVDQKVYPEWMVKWIENPAAYNAHTRMPNFRLSPEESTAIAAFLLSVADREFNLPQAYSGGGPQAVAFGKDLFESIGCRGCHVIGEEAREKVDAYRLNESNDPPVRDHGPELTRVAEKVNPQWLYDWVLNPKHYDPKTRMPSLRLRDWEAHSLTTYLLSLAEPTAKDEALREELHDPKRIEQGRYLVAKRGCYGCHDIQGFENVDRIAPELTAFATKTTDEMFFGYTLDKDSPVKVEKTWEDWARHKLKQPDIYDTAQIKHLMPTFNLKDQEVETLLVFLRGQDRVRERPPWAYEMNARRQAIDRGQHLVDYYNCKGCHVIEDKGGTIRAYIAFDSLRPPNLKGVGQKLQAQWLFEFLHRPSVVRPWLKVRMPSFQLSDDDFASLVRYFEALDGVDQPYQDPKSFEVKPQSAAKGEVVFRQSACLSCHVLGNTAANLTPEQLAKMAPNLRLARNRLRPQWIEKWLADPSVLMPGTRMPSFFSATTQSTRDEIRDLQEMIAKSENDAEKQMLTEEIAGKEQEAVEQRQTIRTVRDYLLTLGQ